MATILQKANEILDEKNEKLLPENLRKDITCLGITGTLEELAGEEITITPDTEEQVITPTEGKNGITKATVSAVTNEIDTNITAENIKKDISILGVTGTLEEGIDTSDATATADDIISGESAYVNGEKIEGTLPYYYDFSGTNLLNVTSSDSEYLHASENFSKGVYNGTIAYSIPVESVAEVIGLTADKIKAGETILGITGTYTGETTTEPETSDSDGDPSFE